MKGMRFTKPQLIILGVVGSIILIVLLMVVFGFGLRKDIGLANVELEFWGVGDEPRVWQDAISKFESVYSNVNIRYTKFEEDNYEKQLLDALASGMGPDIFMFHNTWFTKHANKVVPVGQDQLALSTFRNLFPVVAEQDFVEDNQIFASPVYIDTLALLYNRDIFDNKRIALAPATWDELEALILKTREFGANGNLSKAALSIGGTTKSVPNATDILSMLMLQYRTEMMSSDGSRASISNPQGAAALNFYTQFSTPGNVYYTWSDSFKPSIDSFVAKQTAMILAYASEIPEIKAKNPALNFVVTPAPQFNKSEAVNFANYWGLSASLKSPHPNEAWDFIIFATTDVSVARDYIISANKPPAMRFLINEYLPSPILGAFAAQALTARSWRQPDNAEVRRIFNDMIESAITGKFSTDNALREAENELTEVIKQR